MQLKFELKTFLLIVLTLFVSMADSPPVHGQGKVTIDVVKTLPAKCSPTGTNSPVLVWKKTATVGLYECTATDTWSFHTNVTTSGPVARTVAYWTAGGALGSLALTNGQLVVGSTGAIPVAATLTGTANETLVTNGAGSITLGLAATVQHKAGANFLFTDTSDTTKKFQFDASGITTGTTRTYGMPNANDTLLGELGSTTAVTRFSGIGVGVAGAANQIKFKKTVTLISDIPADANGVRAGIVSEPTVTLSANSSSEFNGIDATPTIAGTANHTGNFTGGRFAPVFSSTGGSGANSIIGVNLLPQNLAGSAAGWVIGAYVQPESDIGNVGEMSGIYNALQVYGGTVAMASSVYTLNPSASGGTITNNFANWIAEQTAGTSNNYAFWYDSPGVFRIKGDGVMAYYNPSFTKYTPGAANYERIVQQWNSNVAEIGTEAGGTGTLRPLRLLAEAGLRIPGTVTAGGTTGAQTINKPTGTVNFAASASSLVVTNSVVTTSSIVFGTVRTNDATCTIKNIVPGSGSFTITMTAACTAETSVGFLVLNQ